VPGTGHVPSGWFAAAPAPRETLFDIRATVYEVRDFLIDDEEEEEDT
jgi:hypothetical protein